MVIFDTAKFATGRYLLIVDVPMCSSRKADW